MKKENNLNEIRMNRMLQTLAAGIWIFMMIFGELFCILSCILLLVFGNINIRLLLLLYVLYFYLDRDTVAHGAKCTGINWIRDNFYWKYFRDYFPLDLVKTVNLPSDKNYLFAVFPHGVLSCGVFGNFISDSPKFRKLFPGIRSKVMTLNMHFKVPIWRELLYSWGLAPASADCIQKVLSSPPEVNNTSTAAVIVVGGAQEALNSTPNSYQLVIKNRKGFVKLALKTGCPIVPVFSFGEVDIFDQKSHQNGSLVRKFQEVFKGKTGLAPVLFTGRGFSIIPHRKSITTVVGAPITVNKILDPTPAEVDNVHNKFMIALRQLFESNKEKYLQNSKNIVLIME